jgi:hypothetical protein
MPVLRLAELLLLTVLVLASSLEAQALLPQSGYVRSSPAPSEEVRRVLADKVRTEAQLEAARVKAFQDPGRQVMLRNDKGPAFPAYTALDIQVQAVPDFLTKIATELNTLGRIESVRRKLTRRALDLRLGVVLLLAVRPLVQAQSERDAIEALREKAQTTADSLDDMANHLPPSPIQQGLVPVLTTEQAQCFWARRGGDYLTGALITAKDDRGAVGLSVIEDYLWPVRFALNSVIAASEAGDTVKKNVDRLLAGGGNAVFGLAWPLLGLSSTAVACPAPGAAAGAASATPGVRRNITQFSSELILAPRLGVDLPALGTAKEDPDVSFDLGVDARVSFQGAQDLLSVFAQARLSRVFGSDEFYEGLSLDPNDGPFGYGQATLGVVLQRKVVLSYSLPIYAPKEIEPLFRGILSIALSR